MNWTPAEMDRLERAIDDASRIQLSRRGTEYIVVPRSVRADFGADVLSAVHAGTGDRIEFRMDEVERFTVLG